MSNSGFKRFAVAWFLGGIVTVVLLAAITGTMPTDHGWLGYLQLVRGGAAIQGVAARTESHN